MVQVLNYSVKDGVIRASFKKKNFIVHGVAPDVKGTTRKEKQQLVFNVCKNSLDYEYDLFNKGELNSITTNESGVEFTPESPKATSLAVNFSDLVGKVYDQYGNLYSADVAFAVVGTDKASIVDNKVTEEEVDEDTRYTIVATFENLEERKVKTILKTKPQTEHIADEVVSEFSTVVAEVDKRVKTLEVLEVDSRIQAIEELEIETTLNNLLGDDLDEA